MAYAPQWLTALVHSVANHIEPHAELGPLAFCWGEEEGFWEVTVYPTPGEVIGGASDGTLIVPGFSLDVQNLMLSFDRVIDVSWCSHPFGPYDNTGQHISIEGVFQGHEVHLQILAEAPEYEEPGFTVALSKPERSA